jgi:hypothetical protein
MSKVLFKSSSLICLSLFSITTGFAEEQIEESMPTQFLPVVREKSVSIVKNLAARVQDLIVQVEAIQNRLLEIDQTNLVVQVETLRAQILQAQENREKNDLSPLQESLGKLFSEIELIKNQVGVIEEKQNQSNVEQTIGNIVLHLKSAEENILTIQSKLESVGSLEALNTLSAELEGLHTELKSVIQKVDEAPTMNSVKQLAIQVNNVQNELQDVKVDVKPPETTRVVLDNATTRGRYGGFLTGEWLLWQFYEGGTDYATSFDGASQSLTGARNKNVSFDWKSGFRVGLGYIFERDDWDLYATYTQVNGKGKKEAHGNIFPLLLYQPGITSINAVNSVEDASAHWRIEFKNADLDLGREFFVSNRISIHPALGIKGAWIDQKLRVKYENEYFVHARNDFSGVGPKLGIGTNWFLAPRFSIYGNIAGALLWGEFRLRQTQEQNDVDDVNLRSHLQKLAPAAQIRAGFLWDAFFNRKRNHFGINLGWEMQYWWDQNQLERFTNTNLPTYLRTSDDLSMQGLTLGLRFDY